MTRLIIKTILSAFLIFSFWSCEDVVIVDNNFEEAELVVDAWINQLPETQTIQLSLSQNYFDATQPAAVTNAQVAVRNEATGKVMLFEHTSGGNYEWTPANGELIGEPGDEFSLGIQYGDLQYAAFSQLNPVPPVDSITYEYREPELGNPEGIYAEFFARDLPGIGDSYWIKAYKNGEFLNKPIEMNVSYDGTFDGGSGTDGIVFIPPIRELINRFPDPSDFEDNSDVPPYEVGDSIRVEIHAVTNEAARFLGIAFEQMTNGFNGIFALPVANSPSNIFPIAEDSPAALGFFNVASISSNSIVVE